MLPEYSHAAPIILDLQQPVSLRLAKDIACHINLSGYPLILISGPGWPFQLHGLFGPVQLHIEAGSILFSGVALKCATPDSGGDGLVINRKITICKTAPVR